jgi:hypothetical protein
VSTLHRSGLLLALAGVLAAGCTDPVDKAAKQRIFSPEDPPQAVASAAEKLQPQEVATDAYVARRVLGMGAAEATERLGPHTYAAEVSFEWRGTGTVKLTEKRTLLAGPGGVAGDFHATTQNSRDQGLEVIRVGGQVYSRNRYGTFRHRRRDRGIAEREREELFGALRDFDRLFHGRMALKPVGTVTHEGRTAWKYDVVLGPPSALPQAKIPPVKFARNGPDQTTLRRIRFFEQRQPAALSGEVLVDADSSVVVKARLDGRINAPAEGDDEVSLRLTLNAEVSGIGKDPKIAAPADYLPDADKPQGIADALDQFGIPRERDRAAAEAASSIGAELPDEE